jgi:hypothetical protein
MKNETLIEESKGYFFQQVESDIGDLNHYSTDLNHLLREHGWPLDNLSAETFEQTEPGIDAEARRLGDSLPFATLVIYLKAFAAVIEKRIKA